METIWLTLEIKGLIVFFFSKSALWNNTDFFCVHIEQFLVPVPIVSNITLI